MFLGYSYGSTHRSKLQTTRLTTENNAKQSTNMSLVPSIIFVIVTDAIKCGPCFQPCLATFSEHQATMFNRTIWSSRPRIISCDGWFDLGWWTFCRAGGGCKDQNGCGFICSLVCSCCMFEPVFGNLQTKCVGSCFVNGMNSFLISTNVFPNVQIELAQTLTFTNGRI